MPPINLTDSPRIRVLVVEDEANDQELLLRQLTKVDFQEHVKFVQSGVDALKLLTEPNTELIPSEIFMVFLDLKLPGMCGIDFLKVVRSVPSFAQLPVVVMTSSIDPRDREECERLKVTIFLRKPVTFQTFAQALATVFHVPYS